MTTTEIERIVNEKIALLKKSAQYSGQKEKEPEYNPVYKKGVELRDRMEVHAILDKKPYDLMKRRGPYEDKLQYEYREKNWQSITMPYFAKARGKLNRIMNPNNYAIQWKEGQAEQQEYFNKQVPVFGSIHDFFEQVYLDQKIIDPNSLLIVRPYYLPMKEVEGEDGKMELYFDDQQEIEVTPVIIDCKHVIDFRQGVFALILLEEKSMVWFGGKQEKTGFIFEFYDTENIYRIEQVGKKGEFIFSKPYIYYNHALGYLPAEKLKGFPVAQELHIYYQSYFINAIPHWDTALYENSNLDISTVTQMFPQRSEYVDKCDDAECQQGYKETFIGQKRTLTACTKCKGTGTISMVGPMMVKQISVGNSLDPTQQDNAAKLFPGVAYTAPPSEPLEFVYKKLQNDLEQGGSFIDTQRSNSDVKGSDTALGKQIDREEMFSFLMKISNETFQAIQFVIDAMGRMRWGSSFEPPKVIPPTTFAMRSEGDLTQELIDMKEAGVPDIATREVVRELMGKRFSTSKDVNPVIELAFAVDRFITCSRVEMASHLLDRTAMKWEAVLHDTIYTFIDNILVSDSKFFEKKLPYQKEQLIKMAKELDAQINADTQNSGSTATVLDIANDDTEQD